jgi:hypothetical protein
MNRAPERIIRETESVCPVCLAQLPAVVYETAAGEVHMEKECPQHGSFDVYLWPDAQRYRWHAGLQLPSVPRAPQTARANGCPNDCGLCPGHERSITLPEVEVTWRCNVSCPVCFMFDGEVPADPSLEELRCMFASIQRFDGQNLPIQITGGEPTVHTLLHLRRAGNRVRGGGAQYQRPGHRQGPVLSPTAQRCGADQHLPAAGRPRSGNDGKTAGEGPAHRKDAGDRELQERRDSGDPFRSHRQRNQ